jgi:superfamily I DNA and RNA helicase
MKRCYRTPGPILTVAHAIGMGLLRPEGMLSGFTRQRDWEAIGYQVLQGSFSSAGQTITLYRPPGNKTRGERRLHPYPPLSHSMPTFFI